MSAFFLLCGRHQNSFCFTADVSALSALRQTSEFFLFSADVSVLFTLTSAVPAAFSMKTRRSVQPAAHKFLLLKSVIGKPECIQLDAGAHGGGERYTLQVGTFQRAGLSLDNCFNQGLEVSC